jgi:hypothetical protein
VLQQQQEEESRIIQPDMDYGTLHNAVVQRSRENSAVMTQYIFGYHNAECHNVWHDFIDNNPYGLILSFRDSGKTEQITVGRILWEIGKNPNIRIKLATESEKLATDILSRISETILSNTRYQEVFPHIKKSKRQKWTRSALTVERDEPHKDKTLEAAGVLTSATGGRADLCYDAETEILTDQGWKLFRDLNKTEKVATLNAEGFLEYQYPQNYIQYDYSGELFCLNGEQINFRVTPGHNMYVGKIIGKHTQSRSPLELRSIEDVYGLGRVYFKKDCLWKGKTQETITIPEYVREWKTNNAPHSHVDVAKSIPAAVFFAFVGIFMAEGNVTFKYGRPCGVTLGQIEGENLDKIQSLLDSFPFPYKKYDRKLNTGNIFYEFKINNVQLGQYMMQFGHGACNKKIPRWILECDSDSLKILYDWYKLGDGGTSYVSTSSKELSENLQELAFKSGFVLRERIQDPGVMTSPSTGKVYNTQTHYVLTENFKKLLPKVTYGKQKGQWKKEYYSGEVFCVSVPNKIIYVRRKGASFWCGNCIFDDIAGMRNTLAFPKLRPMVKEAVYSNWMNLLDGESARWYCIGTPWHIEDIISEFRNNSAIPKSRPFMVGPAFESPWPEKYSPEYFKMKLSIMGRKHFNRAYRLQPINDEESWLNAGSLESCKDWTIKRNEVAEDHNLPKFTGVDLGHRSGMENSPTVVFTVALTPTGKRIPCDIRISNEASPLDIARVIINVNQELEPAITMVENVGAQQQMVELVKTLGPGGFNIEGYFTSTQKLDPEVGVPSMLAEIEAGKWVIPLGEGGEHNDACECKMCRWTNELIDFPQGRIDTVMASWLALMGLRKLKERANQGGNFSVWSYNVGGVYK